MEVLDTLELTSGSTLEDAKRNFHRLSKQYHPDKNPNAKDHFLKILQAYQSIKDNPSLLTNQTTNSALGYTKLSIDASIEDFYYGREKIVNYERKIPCKTCMGTGSKYGLKGVCPHCFGEGTIENSVFAMLKDDSTCPMCKGSGIKDQKYCEACHGSKYGKEIIKYKVTLYPYHYHKKAIYLKNAGDQINKNEIGDVYIKLNIIPDTSVKIEEDYFCIYKNIIEVQSIIGDEDEIEIFGRKLKFYIGKNSTETYIKDKIREGLTQAIRIKFITRPPLLNNETITLYQDILKLEKDNLPG
jgi:DnaJ-class molecular chaperone